MPGRRLVDSPAAQRGSRSASPIGRLRRRGDPSPSPSSEELALRATARSRCSASRRRPAARASRAASAAAIPGRGGGRGRDRRRCRAGTGREPIAVTPPAVIAITANARTRRGRADAHPSSSSWSRPRPGPRPCPCPRPRCSPASSRPWCPSWERVGPAVDAERGTTAPGPVRRSTASAARSASRTGARRCATTLGAGVETAAGAGAGPGVRRGQGDARDPGDPRDARHAGHDQSVHVDLLREQLTKTVGPRLPRRDQGLPGHGHGSVRERKPGRPCPDANAGDGHRKLICVLGRSLTCPALPWIHAITRRTPSPPIARPRPARPHGLARHPGHRRPRRSRHGHLRRPGGGEHAGELPARRRAPPRPPRPARPSDPRRPHGPRARARAWRRPRPLRPRRRRRRWRPPAARNVITARRSTSFTALGTTALVAVDAPAALGEAEAVLRRELTASTAPAAGSGRTRS